MIKANFLMAPQVQALKEKLDAFVKDRCIPAEAEIQAHIKTRFGEDRWTMDAIPPCIERLKQTSKSLGLWNLFIPPFLAETVPSRLAPSRPLSYREYGILCKSTGRSILAPEACNCSAPDTATALLNRNNAG